MMPRPHEIEEAIRSQPKKPITKEFFGGNRNKEFDLSGVAIPLLCKGDFEDLEEIEAVLAFSLRKLREILNR